MSDIVKIEWTETSRFSAYVLLPEGKTYETLDQDDYDLENDLGDINDDEHFDGLTRSDIEIYNQSPPPGWCNGVAELPWSPA